MATYVQRIHLNRPINTRLIIAVRFVVTAAVSGALSRVDAPAGTQPHRGSAAAFPYLVASQEQGPYYASREAATVGVRETVAMRLRVVDPKDASTMKEYHHAESLPA
ncbi:hypothetical protein [Dictyobacter formicarum]|uniref:Uncharacterized protein n=1 Tax=Dictyobacter formicarum TaxID=2778368 RepID=A0ABQ3VNE5_9CHLR|nr:hypothetical protein [Dictyobacter formicarum]GHO87315.1 hypothetical protein KSZ_53210 [Dictyobacter formicarum]